MLLNTAKFAAIERRIVFPEDRRTGIVVDASTRNAAIKQARLKKKRGSNHITTVRKLTPQELRMVEQKRWIRTGPQGQPAGYKGQRGQGPPLGGYK